MKGEKIPQQKENKFLSLTKITFFVRFKATKVFAKSEEMVIFFISNRLKKMRVLISCIRKDKKPIPKTAPTAKISVLGSERGISSMMLEINFWHKNKVFEVNRGEALYRRVVITRLTVNAERMSA